ncbi:MFS transporter [Amycolatopsis samaneae]|uniref:MFS transporter n=1 Tax=Amycolatopsis samaneae TaxID=664691 RepID=A0ABW5GKD4_9PSEU
MASVGTRAGSMSEESPSRLLLVVLATSTLVSAMGNSMMTVVLPQIRTEFSASLTALGWTATAQLLAVAVCTPLCGRFCEVFGLRAVFCASGLTFAVASSAAVFAPGMGTLIAARAVQGVGGAGLIVTASVAVVQLVPAGRRGRVLGLTASGTAVGQASGPALGGFVAQAAGWRAMFVVTAVLTLVVLLGSLRALPAGDPAARGRGRRVDLAGAGMFAGGVALSLVALTQGAQTGAADAVPLVTGLVSLLFFAGFGWRMFTAAEPFVPSTLLADKRFLAACVLGFLGLCAFLATETLIPLLSASANDLGSGQVGLVLLPGTVAMILISGPAGRWLDRAGTRVVATTGLLVTGGSAVFLSTFAGASPVVVSLGMLGIGVGFAVTTVPAQAAASFAVTKKGAGAGLGLFQSVYSLGGAVGAVVSPAMLAVREGTGDGWNILHPGGATHGFSDALLLVGVPALAALAVVPFLARGPREGRRRVLLGAPG